MSEQLRDEVNQYCSHIRGDARLVLNHVAFRAALSSENPELFDDDGYRLGSRTQVGEREAWIKAEDFGIWCGLWGQNRTRALNKLRDEYGLDLRLTQARVGEATLYGLPEPRTMIIQRERWFKKSRQSNAETHAKREATKARNEALRVSALTGSTVATIGGSPDFEGIKIDRLEGIKIDTPQGVTGDSHQGVKIDSPIDHVYLIDKSGNSSEDKSFHPLFVPLEGEAQAPPEHTYSVREVAAITGLTESTIHAHIKAERIPTTKEGRFYRIAASAIAAINKRNLRLRDIAPLELWTITAIGDSETPTAIFKRKRCTVASAGNSAPWIPTDPHTRAEWLNYGRPFLAPVPDPQHTRTARYTGMDWEVMQCPDTGKWIPIDPEERIYWKTVGDGEELTPTPLDMTA